ncbi:hypothetical protein BC936DRAFT_149318 [Jimgerdemannia flammicorona]|uniref:Uncharacterized protein n=1 Tax=Jimgerdemannia flammicorona TaxID=994334 RepID=A0A433D131_9FUNG|nr:hypothetical protein BC936DRAFT_149318 [Jimgerdemannia flammicorona]
MQIALRDCLYKTPGYGTEQLTQILQVVIFQNKTMSILSTSQPLRIRILTSFEWRTLCHIWECQIDPERGHENIFLSSRQQGGRPSSFKELSTSFQHAASSDTGAPTCSRCRKGARQWTLWVRGCLHLLDDDSRRRHPNL